MNYSKPEIMVVGDGAELIQGIPTPHKEPNMVDPGPFTAE